MDPLAVPAEVEELAGESAARGLEFPRDWVPVDLDADEILAMVAVGGPAARAGHVDTTRPQRRVAEEGSACSHRGHS